MKLLLIVQSLEGMSLDGFERRFQNAARLRKLAVGLKGPEKVALQAIAQLLETDSRGTTVVIADAVNRLKALHYIRWPQTWTTTCSLKALRATVKGPGATPVGRIIRELGGPSTERTLPVKNYFLREILCGKASKLKVQITFSTAPDPAHVTRNMGESDHGFAKRFEAETRRSCRVYTTMRVEATFGSFELYGYPAKP